MIEDTITESAVEVELPKEKNVEISLDEKTPSIDEDKPKIKVKDKSRDEDYVDERQKALDDLKSQYEHQKRVAEAEREARRQAEYYAKQQAQQANYARSEVQDGNLRIIINAIDATEQAAANAERDYSEAMAAGDYALAAKAQRAIAQAESHLLQLNNGRQKLEEMLQYQTTEGAVREPEIPSFEPNIPQNPVEIYASKLTPKSADWLRSHPEVVNQIDKLTAAHSSAVQFKGLEPESPEYFKYIEKKLGYSGGYKESKDRKEAREEPRRQKMNLSSAPVSSSGSMSSMRGGDSPRSIVLSPAEVEMAILAEPELPREKAIEAYAINKSYLIKQGKLSS